MKYTEVEDEYQCDDCKKSFQCKNIKLVDPAPNVKIFMPVNSFMYVDKNGIITGGSSQASLDRGDKILACPECGYIHLFGFDIKEKNASI